MNLATCKFLFLILVLSSVGVTSFTVEVGVANSIPSYTQHSSRSSRTRTPFYGNTCKRSSSRSSSRSIMSSSNLFVSTTNPTAQSIDDTAPLALPWRDTNHSPLTGNELRNLVVEAAVKEEECDEDEDFLDVPGVAWMEHINLIVGDDRPMAESFYIDTMGMTADKSKSFHVNLGRQQFHLATPQKSSHEIPHRIHGSVGLVIPDPDALWDRLQKTRDETSEKRHDFRGTLFDFYRERGDGDDDGDSSTATIHVRCPWGNVFRCYSASDRGSTTNTTTTSVPSTTQEEELSLQKMTNLHAPKIGVHGADKLGVLSVGQPGIRFVEFVLPGGVRADRVCEFYQQTLRCKASVARTAASGVRCCLVSVGPGIHLVFVEAAASSAAATTKAEERDFYHGMKGIHLCIYAHDFHGLYQRLKERSLVWTNPRFTYLDRCDTWEDAKKCRTLRFRHIVDAENNVLMELEHETRPLRHGQFLKVPYYVPN